MKNRESSISFGSIEEQRAALVDQIISDMETCGAEWVKPWAGHFAQRNAVSGTEYRGGNRMHLAFISRIRGYEDPRWCTFKQAIDKGWSVRKGAKSARIEKWKMIAAEKELADGTTKSYAFPKLVGSWCVFNAADVDGMPSMPDFSADHAEDAAGAVADGLIASSRCPVREMPGNDIAAFSPLRDEIIVPSREIFISDEAFTRTLAHEMTHSTAVPLGRPLVGAFGSEKYAFEELVAELGAMFTCTALGVDGTQADERHYEQHLAYLKSWCSALRENAGLIFSAASKADAAAAFIVDRYNALTDAAEPDAA